MPLTAYETGILTNGTGDPNSPFYNSLSDWYAKGDTLEIRIPWQMLNFMAPSKGRIMDDFYAKKGFSPTGIQSVKAGVNSGSAAETIGMGNFNLKTWDMPAFRERLKQSYSIVKDKFASIN